MGSRQERAFEVVVLAASFRDRRGRAFIAEYFPQSVLDLYDVVVARGDWRSATDLTEQALVVARVLDEDPQLEARYQADVDAGELGFGDGEDDEMDTAVANVTRELVPLTSAEPPDDGLLGGGGDEERPWRPEMPMAPPPPAPSAPPPPAPSTPPPPAPSPPRSPATSAPPPPSPPRTPPAAPPRFPEPTPLPFPEEPEPLPELDPETGGPPPADGPGDPEEAANGEETESDTIHSWLNAELDSGGEPLQVAKPYTLAVYFGEESATAVAAAPTVVAIPREEEWIDLSVEVTSSDFDVPPFPQQLRLRRDGRSANRALFEITPLRDGESKLTVIVSVKGNFLQRLDITFDVGAASAPEVHSYGRPAGAASLLDERVATLQFTAEDWGYELIALQVSPDPIKIEITPFQLAARITAIRDVLLAAVEQRHIALEMDITDEDNAEILGDLAYAGFRLYQTVFEGNQATPELRKVGEWLRESLSEDVRTLQVVSSGFPVPWALMYLADRFDPAALSWDSFIGMQHVVEQIPLTKITPVPPATTIESTPELTVRAVYNESIDVKMPSKPIAEQRRYWGARGVALTEGISASDLIHGALAPDAGDKVLYLYCHAESNDDDTDDSKLILTGSERVTLGDLEVFAPTRDQLEGHPLVFINACESGDLTPIFYAGFVSYFLAKGARGVVGTECKTPGLFASEWAKAFFDELFAGRPLGEVVLTLRRRFLADHNNPFGLLYGVHCDTDTVVAPALTASPG